MRLSVVICTHNRASTLAETLAALGNCLPPEGVSIETLVVANACTDATAHVVEAAGVALVEEPTPGLSHARNAGLSAATGEAILWLDDDVTPDAALLLEYASALANFEDVDVFGGPIRPVLLGQPPGWAEVARQVIPTVWSARDLGPRDRPMDLGRGEYPYGANMLIRRRAAAGAFRTDLGRKGRGARILLGAEEREFLARLGAAGARARWVARAGVDHRISADRQTLSYVARYFRGVGYQSVLLGTSARIGTLRRDARLVRNSLRYAALRVGASADQWLPAYAALNQTLGQRAAHRNRKSL